jgi:hypothetical protein
MQMLGAQLARSLSEIGRRNNARPAADAENLKAAIPKLRAVARKLAAIVPPRRVRAQHELLRKAVLEFADELRGPIVQLEEGDLNGLGDIFGLEGVRDMEAVSSRIEKMGYQIVAKPKG